MSRRDVDLDVVARALAKERSVTLDEAREIVQRQLANVPREVAAAQSLIDQARRAARRP